MSFVSRPSGYTLRRMRAAPLAPRDERFDPEHPVTMRCGDCGQLGHGPRKHLKEALEEHRKVCPARRAEVSQHVTQLWYPSPSD